jgi:hypothetical protein
MEGMTLSFSAQMDGSPRHELELSSVPSGGRPGIVEKRMDHSFSYGDF